MSLLPKCPIKGKKWFCKLDRYCASLLRVMTAHATRPHCTLDWMPPPIGPRSLPLAALHPLPPIAHQPNECRQRAERDAVVLQHAGGGQDAITHQLPRRNPHGTVRPGTAAAGTPPAFPCRLALAHWSPAPQPRHRLGSCRQARGASCRPSSCWWAGAGRRYSPGGAGFGAGEGRRPRMHGGVLHGLSLAGGVRAL